MNTRGFKCDIVVAWTVERAIAEMQSLFSCLFALLLYAGSRTRIRAMSARLLQEHEAAGDRGQRGVEQCAIETV